MQKTDAMDFGSFNRTIQHHVNRTAKNSSQGGIYNILFGWIYDDDAGRRPDFTLEDRSNLARWLGGTRPIHSRIINASLNAGSLPYYKDAFDRLIDGGVFDDLMGLGDALVKGMEKTPQLTKGRNIDEKDDGDILANALVTALTVSHIRHGIKIEPQIENEMRRRIADCKNAGQAFTTPHALLALLSLEDSLLYGAFENLHKGFGYGYLAKLEQYASERHRAVFQPITLDNLDFIFNAKLSAFIEGIPTAGETHVIREILDSQSRTVDSLNRKIREYEAETGWTLAECMESVSSSIDFSPDFVPEEPKQQKG